MVIVREAWLKVSNYACRFIKETKDLQEVITLFSDLELIKPAKFSWFKREFWDIYLMKKKDENQVELKSGLIERKYEYFSKNRSTSVYGKMDKIGWRRPIKLTNRISRVLKIRQKYEKDQDSSSALIETGSRLVSLNLQRLWKNTLRPHQPELSGPPLNLVHHCLATYHGSRLMVRVIQVER